MPFAYFQRLTRRQQAIYLDSDGIVTMRLPEASRLQPLVTALAARSRAATARPPRRPRSAWSRGWRAPWAPRRCA